MKRLFRVFVLTPREQRFVVFAVLTLVIGSFIKHHQEKQLERMHWRDETKPLPEQTTTPRPNA